MKNPATHKALWDQVLAEMVSSLGEHFIDKDQHTTSITRGKNIITTHLNGSVSVRSKGFKRRGGLQT